MTQEKLFWAYKFDKKSSEEAYIFALKNTNNEFILRKSVHIIPLINECDQENIEVSAKVLEFIDNINLYYCLFKLNQQSTQSWLYSMSFVHTLSFSIAVLAEDVLLLRISIIMAIIWFDIMVTGVVLFKYAEARYYLLDEVTKASINKFLKDFESYRLNGVKEKFLNRSLAEYWYIIGLSTGTYKLEPNELQAKIKKFLPDEKSYNNLIETMTCPISFNMIVCPYTTWIGSTYDRHQLLEYLQMKYLERQNDEHESYSLVDPLTNCSLNYIYKIVPNKNVSGLLAYLIHNTDGSKISDYPGFLNPKTGKSFKEPLLFSNGLTVEADKENKHLYSKNIMLAQLISQNMQPA